jgi:hypothetical protein
MHPPLSGADLLWPVGFFKQEQFVLDADQDITRQALETPPAGPHSAPSYRPRS